VAFTADERSSIKWTGIATLMAVVGAAFGAALKVDFLLGVCAGGLGGLVHEFAQSGGKVLFVKKEPDGVYLGALTGLILGAVSGVLVVQGHADPQNLAANAFLAGLALKGVVEAAGGTSVPATSGLQKTQNVMDPAKRAALLAVLDQRVPPSP
jgi:hypothetical protein